MRDTCTISFVIEPLSNDQSAISVVPLVNGIRLTDLVKEYELARLYEPAGGYAGLVPAHFNCGPLDQYFMATGTGSPFADKRWLLGCECSEAGCWPLEARILKSEQQVAWQEFAQPFRPERDYSAFGPFRFDFEQYQRAVIDLESSARG